MLNSVASESFLDEVAVFSAALERPIGSAQVLAVTLERIYNSFEEQDFFRLVRAGFTASRKQVVNSLAQGLDLPKEDVHSLLVKADIDPRRRAETFTVQEWAQLWHVFDESEVKQYHAGD